MSKAKKAAPAPTLTADEIAGLPELDAGTLHYQFVSTTEDGAETVSVEKGAPAHGGGLRVNGREAASVRRGKGDKAPVFVQWKDGETTEYPGVDEVRALPDN